MANRTARNANGVEYSTPDFAATKADDHNKTKVMGRPTRSSMAKKYPVVVLAVALQNLLQQRLNAIDKRPKFTSLITMRYAIFVLKLRVIASVRSASQKNVQNGSANPNG